MIWLVLILLLLFGIVVLVVEGLSEYNDEFSYKVNNDNHVYQIQ